MRLGSYADGTNPPSWGVAVGDGQLIGVAALGSSMGQSAPASILELLTADRLDWLRSLLDNASESQLQEATVGLGEVRLVPPIGQPGKVIAIGRNYRDHADEAELVLPKWPKLFPKFASTMVGHHDAVEIPSITTQLDFEVEVGVVIGKPARYVSEEDAADYIAGYTVINDISARDIQFVDEQLTLGKNFATFCPIGPFLTTADEMPDPEDIGLSLRLNGEQMQESNTANLIFSIRYLISFLSYVGELQPGDIIATGTPAGVGCFRNPPVWLAAGDILESTVDGVGTLVNRVVAPEHLSAPPLPALASAH